jgi:DNA-binding NtrC family response regulator
VRPFVAAAVSGGTTLADKRILQNRTEQENPCPGGDAGERLPDSGLFARLVNASLDGSENRSELLRLALDMLGRMLRCDTLLVLRRENDTFRPLAGRGEALERIPEPLLDAAGRALVTGEWQAGGESTGTSLDSWLLVPVSRHAAGRDLLLMGRNMRFGRFTGEEVEVARAVGTLTGIAESVREPAHEPRTGYAPCGVSEEAAGGPGLVIGRSREMERVMEKVESVCRTEISVFIGGESGTGKELIAREIHRRSHRKDGKFIALNCSAIPEHLIESELFGHVKGAFTSATADRIGLMEEGRGGTFFLDEIADLPCSTQVKLLRVLQEKEIKRVGDNRFRKIHLRFVTATNRDLEKEVGSGRFREDLYYRITQYSILLPPLRDRVGDIPALTAHCLAKYGAEHRGAAVGISGQALDILMGYAWPGNVRELENVLRESILRLGPRKRVEKRDLPERLLRCELPRNDGRNGLRRARRAFDRSYLTRALERNNGNKARTARELQLSRQALYNLLKKLDIPIS